MTETLERLTSELQFSQLDIGIIILNLFTLLLSPLLIRWAAHNRSEKDIRRRINALRIINVIILLTYLCAIFFQLKVGQAFAKISLTLMLAFAINHLLQLWITERFGTERELDGQVVNVRSYTSGLIGLVALTFVIALSFVAILNILELDNWLQASSLIGAFLLILYACKDFILSDMIASLVIHYNRAIEPGNLIEIEELNILGVVQQITLTQCTIRDLVRGHEVIVATSKLRLCVIKNYSHTSNNIKDYVDYNISYQVSHNSVSEFFHKLWEQIEVDSLPIEQGKLNFKVFEAGDHAITWRLFYTVKTPYKLMEAKQGVNRLATQLSTEFGFNLGTPLTHEVLRHKPIGKES